MKPNREYIEFLKVRFSLTVITQRALFRSDQMTLAEGLTIEQLN
jgi:hypothetical protein